mgnify:CR=1 FL=1
MVESDWFDVILLKNYDYDLLNEDAESTDIESRKDFVYRGLNNADGSNCIVGA